jgi:hypothetical protein
MNTILSQTSIRSLFMTANRLVLMPDWIQLGMDTCLFVGTARVVREQRLAGRSGWQTQLHQLIFNGQMRRNGATEMDRHNFWKWIDTTNRKWVDSSNRNGSTTPTGNGSTAPTEMDRQKMPFFCQNWKWIDTFSAHWKWIDTFFLLIGNGSFDTCRVCVTSIWCANYRLKLRN